MSIPAPKMFGVKPTQAIKRETQNARIVLYLKAQGMSNLEVGEVIGMSPSWVSQITRQPWFLENLTQILHTTGMEAIRNKLATYGALAADKAFEMMNDAKSENVRATCAFQLMKVGIGETTNIRQETIVSDPMALAEELKRKEAELELLTAQPKESPCLS